MTSKEYLEQLEKDLEAKLKSKEEKQCARAARQQAKKVVRACEVCSLCSVVTTKKVWSTNIPCIVVVV